MNTRTRIRDAVAEKNLETIEEIVKKEPRAVRYLMGLMYELDDSVRKIAAEGIALSSKHHPKLAKNVINRLIWAMNNDAGANSPFAPEVLKAIAGVKPELLLPVVSDIVRCSTDSSLQQGLYDTLRIVKEKCPGEIGKILGAELKKQGF